MARKKAEVRVRLNCRAVWEHMARQNMSQNELARRIGISSGHLSQLVNGQRNASPSLRKCLLKILPGASFDEIFIIESEIPSISAQTYSGASKH